MNRTLTFNRAIGIGVLAVSLAGTGGTSLAGSSCSNSEKADIIATAIGAGSFDTLVTAVKAAGLVGALQADGPITVFAPTDDAFAKLPKGTVETLLKPENKAMLAAILKYHVAPGRLKASDVVDLDRVKTLNGQRPAVVVANGRVQVGAANVTQTDIMTSNGVIHVIDTVLMPENKNILATAAAAGNFTTLAAALQIAGLDSALQGAGPFTVFAPTDEAFAKLPRGTVEALLEPGNKDKLTSILTYHVVPGDIYSADARPGRVKTLQGSDLNVSSRDGNLMIDQARVIVADIVTSNGVIHVIDEVIMPTERSSANRNAQELIRTAINRGAPLYNRGQAGACAAIYEVTAQALLNATEAGLSEHDRMALEAAINDTRGTHDERRQAWIMREALDNVMTSLNRTGTADAMTMSLR